MQEDKKIIRTVSGDILANEIGHTQCHEHIWLRKGPSFAVNPALLIDDEEKSLAELLDYKKAGGSAIVDAQPINCGRCPEVLQRLSEKSGVHIIAVTGFHKKEFWENDSLASLSAEELAEVFASEIEEGMLSENGIRTNIRAGIVKAAYDKGAFEDETYLRFFNAAALAAKKTGAPVLIHTEKNTDIEKMIRFFLEMGIGANRIIICHLDRTNGDLSLHEKLADMGAYLCYDSINRLKYLSEEEEIAIIANMMGKGFAEKLLFGLDTTRARLRSYGADMGLDFILQSFIKTLSERGFETEQICKINPAEALSFK